MKSTTTISVNGIPLSCIPEDGLRFFHGLSNWVEQSKTLKPHLMRWKQGQKALTKLRCIKPKHGNHIELPNTLPCNTIYVPSSSSGVYVLCQLRHAFCHNNLVYDKDSGQYRIELTDKVKIAGQFSLDAIVEFVNVYLTATKH